MASKYCIWLLQVLCKYIIIIIHEKFYNQKQERKIILESDMIKKNEWKNLKGN